MSTDRLYGMSLLLLLCNHIAMGQDARPLVDEAMNQRFKLAADLSFADRLLDIALSSQDTNTQTRGIAAILLRKDRADRYLDLLQEHIKNEDTDPQFAKDLKKIVGEIEALPADPREANAYLLFKNMGAEIKLDSARHVVLLDCNFIHNRVTDIHMPFIRDFPKLTELKIPCCFVSDKALSNLTPISSLRILEVPVTMTDAGLAEIRTLTNLEILGGICEGVTDKGLSYLGNLKSLRKLGLGRSSATDEGMKYIGECKELTELSVPRRMTDKGLKRLLGLSKLKSLDLISSQITDDGLRLVSQLRNLQRIDAQHCMGVRGASLESFADHPALETLKLPENIESVNLRFLPRITRLDFLTLSSSIEESDLPYLCSCKSLRILMLSRKNLSEHCIEDLKRCIMDVSVD